MEDYLQVSMTKGEVNQISNLGLAHIGDGVYELMCRSYLCLKGNKSIKHLHKESVSMVNAPAQAVFAQKLLPYLTEEEQDYYRRGKNAHSHAAPKGASPREYAMATGLETLFGALYLLGQTQRLNELFSRILEEKEA